MTKLYDLETSIMDCWSVCEAIETVVKQIGEGESKPTPDQLASTLLGVQQLYQWRFEQMFYTFEQAIAEGKNK